jgi:hypothetical protein
VLRPAKRPSGQEILTLVKRVIAGIRANWPKISILLRGDGHYACPEVMAWCEAEGLDYLFGLPGTSTLHPRPDSLVAKTQKRYAAAKAADPALPASFKVRRFKEFYDGAKSWNRVRRIIARVEAGSLGTDVRYIVTNLTRGQPRRLYEKLYCRRGQAENFIKDHKTHLASDRTSCPSAAANQFRLFLHGGAYWILWTLRACAPKRSPWRRAQFDTIRLRVIKVAARVIEWKRKITVHLPTSCPDQQIIRLFAERSQRLLI